MEPEKCKHKVVAKYCFRCKRPDLAGPVPEKKIIAGLNHQSHLTESAGVLEPEKDNLNPGSKEAVDKGCKCPVMDNHNGKGVLNGNFWINKECPIHGEPEKKDVWEVKFDSHWEKIMLKDRLSAIVGSQVKNFIRQNFIPKEELREKIEKMKVITPDQKPEFTDEEMDGYNTALNDLLTLLTQEK